MNKNSKVYIFVVVFIISVFTIFLISTQNQDSSTSQIQQQSTSMLQSIGQQSQLGIATLVQEEKWVNTRKDGLEAQLTFWTLDAKDKKTELGWIPPDENCAGWSEKNIYYKNGTEILDNQDKAITLKCESSKCDGQNCYHISLTTAQAVNINDEIKLGNTSSVVEYQNESKIIYNFDWGETNLTLFKENIISGDVYVFYNNEDGKYDFGANDTVLGENFTTFTYIINSTSELILIPGIINDSVDNYLEFPMVYNYYYDENDPWDEERHQYSFEGICNKNYSNCSWVNNGNSAIIYFTSNGTIDTRSISIIDGCATLGTANTEYTLNQSVNSTGTCFTVTAENVTLDCAGYEMNYSHDGTVGYGVYTDQFNTTVKNCIIKEGVSTNANKHGTFFNGATNSTYFNNTFYGLASAHGIDVNMGEFNNITNNSFFPHDFGIRFATSPNNIANNNYIETQSTSDKGMMFYRSVRISIDGLIIYSPLSGSDGVMVLDNVKNLTIRNFNLTANDRSLEVGDGVSQVTLINGYLSSTTDYDIIMGLNSDPGSYVIARNVSFDKSNIGITDPDIDFTVQYYLDVNVTNSSGVIENALVNGTQRNTTLVFSNLTDANGFVAKQIVTEYVQNYTGEENKTYWTNYSVNVTEAGHDQFDDYFNFTGNHMLNITLTIGGAPPVDNSPVVNLLFPANTTSSDTVTTYSFNATITDDINITNATFYLWNETGLVNTTEWLGIIETTEYGANSTFTLPRFGNYTWNYFAIDNASQSSWNDTNYTIEYKAVVDTTFPDINITFPASNNTNTTDAGYDVNYTASDDVALDTCWWRVNEGTVTILADCITNLTGETWTEGLNLVEVYVNDTSNNINSSNITFRLDTINPNVEILYPVNNSNYITIQDMLNYSYSDAGAGFCWYSNESGLTNSTPVVAGVNWSELNSKQGDRTWTVYCNDSVNNVNSSFVNFYVDSVFPWINYTSNTELTGYNTSDNFVYIEVNITESNIVNTTYGLYNSTQIINITTYNTTSEMVLDFEIDYEQGQLIDISKEGLYSTNTTTGTSEFQIIATAQATEFTFDASKYVDGDNGLDAYITFWAWFEDVSLISDSRGIQTVEFGNENIYNQTYWNSDAQFNNYVARDGWNFYVLELSKSTYVDKATINWSEVDYIQFYARNNSPVKSEIYLDDFKIHNGSSFRDINFTGLLDDNYEYNVTVCDTLGNCNNTETRTITIDTTPPTIIFDNVTFVNGTSLDFDVNATDSGVGVAFFAINWTTQFTINETNGSLINSSILSDGEYWINLSVNDTLGNTNYSIMLVNVTTISDIIFPDINITFPATNNTNTTDSSYNINYTVSDDIALDECWYSNDSLSVNYSLIDCTTNITTITWAEGLHYVIVWVNDTSNNVNSSNITFRLDTTAPTIIYDNVTITESQLLDFDVNATDLGVGVDSYVINWTTTFSMNETNGSLTNTSALTPAEYWINITVNDTLNNQASEIILVNVTTIDSIPPEFTIVYPPNNTNSSDAGLHINYTATDGIALDKCWYSNDSLAVNYTLTDCSTNITTVTWAEGEHNVTIFGNDTSGNENQSTIIFFTIDTIFPNIKIIFPATNNTNTTDTGYDVNYTTSDINLDDCWWTEDEGVTNNSLATCTTNITGQTWSEGLNKVIVYSNDSANNINSSNITFRVDTTAPTIIFDNVTFVEGTSLDFDVNATDSGVGVDSYIVNWTTTFAINETNGSLTNISALSIAEYWINITVNDTLNNQESEIMLVNVTVVADIIPPEIVIEYPTNTTYSQQSTDINYTATDDIALSFCWYSNDSGGINSSTQPCGTNWTINYSDGGHNVIVYANDTTNNINSTNVSFFIDSINPLITITSPTNNSNNSDSGLDIEYNFVEINADKCWWTNDSNPVNITLASCGTNITTVTWAEGEHNVTIYINDTANNINSTIIFFNTDSIFPNILISLPANNTNTTDTQIDVNYTFSDTNIDDCWWGNETTNTTLTCGTNITDQTWNEGLNNITLYANDSSNNINFSLVVFRLDTTAPSFTALVNQSFVNNTAFSYDINAVDLGVGISIFNISDTTNFIINSITGVVTNATNLPVGYYEIYVSINDTLGNTNTSLWSVNATNVTIAVSVPTPTEGGATAKEPKSVNLIYPDIWKRDSEVIVTIQVSNDSDDLYIPKSISIKKEIDGILLLGMVNNTKNEIEAIFKVTHSTELGGKKMDLIVQDQRIIESRLIFIVQEKQEIIKKEGIEIYIYWILGGFFVLVFMLMLLIALVKDKKR